MEELDIEEITNALKEAEHFQDFKQILMHALGIATKTDESIHQKNLSHVKAMKRKLTPLEFDPNIHKASYIGDEFEGLR